MKSFIKENLFILIIISVLFLYLGIKALDENGWDGWGFGSAQTLMSSKYWAKDGFAKNYFLFIPSPYSKLTKYLDEPEFRNRPIDDFGGALKRNRIYYTHYPPLYLVPYAIMAKIGVENRAVFRIFSLLVSLAGLIFFYLFIKSIANKAAATIASIYYGFSVTFLNYADSVSIQPWDILFIFLILYLSIVAWRLPAQAGKFNWAIWFIYLALSLSSYDATFYIFAYLVLFDILILKKFLWKRWFFFALVPVMGFALQIIQNTWYLGWKEMLDDISNSYRVRTFVGVKNFIINLIAPFYSMTSLKTVFVFKKTIIALTSAAAIFGILWKFREKTGLNFDYFKIVFVLAIAAVAQPFFVNATGGWPFQGILTAAFWGLLIGNASIFIINIFKQKESIRKTLLFIILLAIILILWSVQFYSTLNYVKDWPNNRPDQKVIDFSKEIKKLYPNEEKIAFRILPKNPIWKSQYGTFNMEYYLGMLKIDFANNQDLLADFWRLRKISKYPFYSFVMTDNKDETEKLRSEIKKTLPKRVSEIKNIQGQYVFVIDPK